MLAQTQSPSAQLAMLKKEDAAPELLSWALTSTVRPLVILGIIHLNTRLEDLTRFLSSGPLKDDEWLRNLANERISEILCDMH